ncbi:MAG: hypothetical protein JNJ69_16630 [Leptospiraceae bacterium]|nr:hypothetical protein [Leptospiraceae bacterium]
MARGKISLIGGWFFFLLWSSQLAAIELPVIELQPNSRVTLHNLPWEFHWQKFIFPKTFNDEATSPDLILTRATIWNGLEVGGRLIGSFGYATFRVRFTSNARDERLALRMPAALSSYRLFVNGEKLAEEGVLTSSAQGFIPKRKSALIYFSGNGGQTEIIIHVANFLLYKGGLRTGIEFGYAAPMQAFGNRYLAIDLFCMGLIFSIMLYHFLLYSLSKKNLPILIFAFVSLDYFLLATFLGEQSVTVFLPSFPLSVQTRLTATFSYLLAPLVVEFTANLYPGTISRRIRSTFWIVALIFVALLVLPVHYFSFYNVFYYATVGFAGALVSLWAVIHAVHEGRAGARLLGGGILILLSLTAYAVYLFIIHEQAGSFLSIGFTLFALAQSGSLARAHAALTHENTSMQLRLEKSRAALDTQRKQIEANLHDSLGGNLTDIKLGLEAIGSDPRARAIKNDIQRLDHRVAGTIASLRTELLFLEDMQLAVQDFVSGINLILLRRYQMARRPVDIDISAETRERGRLLQQAGILSNERIPELCMIIQELCSNSLKYTTGSTRWSLIADEKSLRIYVEGRSRHKKTQQGQGRGNLRQRSAAIGAEFSESLESGYYRATILLG